MIDAPGFRRLLLAWYDAAHRDLPWRRSTDFYPVWISEVMLQQTRVEAVVPYYQRFLLRFPDLPTLAGAPEPDVLAHWSGLGYYSRARNLHAAAKRMAIEGLPANYEAVSELPGIGPYTAAAVASIAFNERWAAVDGNVLRVIARLTNDSSELTVSETRKRIGAEAQRLLDPHRPGDFNQALMELGATVCVPRAPRCGECPVLSCCEARAAGREQHIPVKRKKPQARERKLNLVLLEREEQVFLIQRATGERRMAGLWELPERKLLPGIRGRLYLSFSHRIVNDCFRVQVRKAPVPEALPSGGAWWKRSELTDVPLTGIGRKALQIAGTEQNMPGNLRP